MAFLERREMNTNSDSGQMAIDKFWEFFPPVWHAVKAYIRTQATENFDITVGQFHILRRIKAGKDSVSKLAADRHTSRPAISRAVDVLVKKGLVSGLLKRLLIWGFLYLRLRLLLMLVCCLRLSLSVLMQLKSMVPLPRFRLMIRRLLLRISGLLCMPLRFVLMLKDLL